MKITIDRADDWRPHHPFPLAPETEAIGTVSVDIEGSSGSAR